MMPAAPAATPAAAAETEAAPEAATEAAAEAAPVDIVDTAVAAGSFQTLVAAVQAAELVDTLKGDGPFTVFAPTDEAFAALPAGTLEELLADPKGQLSQILLYHVVPGQVAAADVADAKWLGVVLRVSERGDGGSGRGGDELAACGHRVVGG